eukprot:6001455-Alexandrium_andersonii.AAC.1
MACGVDTDRSALARRHPAAASPAPTARALSADRDSGPQHAPSRCCLRASAAAAARANARCALCAGCS